MLTVLLTVGGLLAFPLVTLAEELEDAGRERGRWEDRWIQKLLRLVTRDFSVLVSLCALLGHLEWFLWSAAFGAQVFGLGLALLLFRAGRFAWMRKAV